MSADDSPLSSFTTGDPTSSFAAEPIQVYNNGHGNGNSPSDEIDSLPSVDTDDTSDEEHEESDAEREWRESLQQLELLLTMVLVPYMGKYFGRKAAYWGWAKFMEWKYPVEVRITSPGIFKAAGAIEAAASL